MDNMVNSHLYLNQLSIKKITTNYNNSQCDKHRCLSKPNQSWSNCRGKYLPNKSKVTNKHLGLFPSTVLCYSNFKVNLSALRYLFKTTILIFQPGNQHNHTFIMNLKQLKSRVKIEKR